MSKVCKMYSILSSTLGLLVQMIKKGRRGRAVGMSTWLRPQLGSEEVLLFGFFAAVLIAFRHNPLQVGTQVASLFLYHRVKLQQLDCDKALLLLCKRSKHSHVTLQCIERYIGEGAAVNTCDSRSRNALIILLENATAYSYDDITHQVVNILIDKGIDVNHTDQNKENSLIKILKNPSICFSEAGLKTVRLLLHCGVNVNCVNNISKMNSLICLLQQNLPVGDETTKLIRLLINKGVDVNHVKSNGRNALMQLFLTNNESAVEIAEILISEGKINVHHVDSNEENALFMLLGNKNLENSKQEELLNLLTNAGINVNQRNLFGESALCRFLRLRRSHFGDCLSITGKLIESGIDIRCNESHESFKMLGVGSCFADSFLEYLSSYKLKPRKDSVDDKELVIQQSLHLLGSEMSGEVLIKLCKTLGTNNLYDITAIFSQLKVYVNCEDASGCNALIALFQNADARCDVILKSATLFLRSKVNPNHVDNHGNNALMTLVQSNHFCLSEMVRLLVEHETDVHQVNISGENALIKFCQHLNSLRETPFYSVMSAKETVQLLVDQGVDVDHSDENDCTALITLFSSPFICQAIPYITSVASILVKSGAYLDSVDASGENVLFKLAKEFTAFEDLAEVIDLMNLFVVNGASISYTPPGCDNPVLTLLTRARDLSPRIQTTQSLRAFREALTRLSPRAENTATTKRDRSTGLLKLLRSALKAGLPVNSKSSSGENIIETLAAFYRGDDFVDVIQLFCNRGIELREDDGQLWVRIVFCLIRNSSFDAATLPEISLLLSDRGLTIPSLSDNTRQRQIAEQVVKDKLTNLNN